MEVIDFQHHGVCELFAFIFHARGDFLFVTATVVPGHPLFFLLRVCMIECTRFFTGLVAYVAPAGEEHVVWAQVRGGQIAKVHCKPDIGIDDLKGRIKEEFTHTLGKWDRADLTLKFKDRVLKPHEAVADVITDEKDDSGEPVPVIVVAP